MEALIEVLLLILFVYPGAIVRWPFYRGRRTIKQLASDDAYLNGMIGLTFCAIIVVLFKTIFF